MGTAVSFMKALVGFVLVLVTNYIAKKIDTESGIM